VVELPLRLPEEHVATDCDTCHVDIPYGVTCWAVPTGEHSEEGHVVVRIECGLCRQGTGV